MMAYRIETDRLDKVLAELREQHDKAKLTPLQKHAFILLQIIGYLIPIAILVGVSEYPDLDKVGGVAFATGFLVSLAAIFLFVLSPFILVIALAIKLDSRGPVLFRQPRYGFNNNLVQVLKFRTMYHHLGDPDATVLTTRDDPRVTRFGSFLRRRSFDELPQLINVLKGQMSLVGPRPHAVAATADGQFYYDAVEQYAARHRVKPGITGWAQVNGYRGETDTVDKIQKRVEYDLYYIDNWSVWFDLWIIMKTVMVLFKDERAY